MSAHPMFRAGNEEFEYSMEAVIKDQRSAKRRECCRRVTRRTLMALAALGVVVVILGAVLAATSNRGPGGTLETSKSSSQTSRPTPMPTMVMVSNTFRMNCDLANCTVSFMLRSGKQLRYQLVQTPSLYTSATTVALDGVLASGRELGTSRPSTRKRPSQNIVFSSWFHNDASQDLVASALMENDGSRWFLVEGSFFTKGGGLVKVWNRAAVALRGNSNALLGNGTLIVSSAGDAPLDPAPEQEGEGEDDDGAVVAGAVDPLDKVPGRRTRRRILQNRPTRTRELLFTEEVAPEDPLVLDVFETSPLAFFDPARPGDCYRGDSRLHVADISVAVDYGFYQRQLALNSNDPARTAQAVLTEIESYLSVARVLWLAQLNVMLRVSHVEIGGAQSKIPLRWSTVQNTCGGGAITALNYLQNVWVPSRSPAVRWGGATLFLSDCLGADGVGGVAQIGSFGMDGVTSVPVVAMLDDIDVAHELGHAFGGHHTFDQGVSKTGGVMDYGTGVYDGSVQFHPANRPELCGTIDRLLAAQSKYIGPSPDARMDSCGDNIVNPEEMCECVDGSQACGPCEHCRLTTSPVQCATDFALRRADSKNYIVADDETVASAECCVQNKFVAPRTRCGGGNGFCSYPGVCQETCTVYGMASCGVDPTGCYELCRWGSQCRPLLTSGSNLLIGLAGNTKCYVEGRVNKPGVCVAATAECVSESSIAPSPPSLAPTPFPTDPTTPRPTAPPTEAPTPRPSLTSSVPSASPSKSPQIPTPRPSRKPSPRPTSRNPSGLPTKQPSTRSPVSLKPTRAPEYETVQPSSKRPTTRSPFSKRPSVAPSRSPLVFVPETPRPTSNKPTTRSPFSKRPSVTPSKSPAVSVPETPPPTSNKPTKRPSSARPTKRPTTPRPTLSPSEYEVPSSLPTRTPSSRRPSRSPTSVCTTLTSRVGCAVSQACQWCGSSRSCQPVGVFCPNSPSQAPSPAPSQSPVDFCSQFANARVGCLVHTNVCKWCTSTRACVPESQATCAPFTSPPTRTPTVVPSGSPTKSPVLLNCAGYGNDRLSCTIENGCTWCGLSQTCTGLNTPCPTLAPSSSPLPYSKCHDQDTRMNCFLNACRWCNNVAPGSLIRCRETC